MGCAGRGVLILVLVSNSQAARSVQQASAQLLRRSMPS
jgi:hypothetical protein